MKGYLLLPVAGVTLLVATCALLTALARPVPPGYRYGYARQQHLEGVDGAGQRCDDDPQGLTCR